jgi:hypothetical protein
VSRDRFYKTPFRQKTIRANFQQKTTGANLSRPYGIEDILKPNSHNFRLGSQIFLGTTCQNGKNIPNNHKIYQMDLNKNMQDPQKITRKRVLGLKICHLATLILNGF